MMLFICIAVLAFLFVLFNELEDETVRGHNFSLFPNSDDASTAKWKYPFETYIPKWYHFGIKHSHAERFAFSSTIFVFLMDAEHTFQFFKFLCVTIAFFIISWQVGLSWLIGKVIGTFVKELLPNIN